MHSFILTIYRQKVVFMIRRTSMGGCPFKSLLGNQAGALSLFRKEELTQVNIESNQPSNSNKEFQTLLRKNEGTQIKFVGLSEEDISHLVEIRPIMEKNAPIIVEAFYGKLQDMPNLLGIINKHSTIDKLKKTLTQYLLDMVSGKIGEEYVIRRKVIGNVHNRIGLFPEWYIGAYTLIQNEMLQILTKELDTWEEVMKYYLSFQRLCSFDMQIGIETYIESYTSSMMKLNEIEELQSRLNDSASTLAASAEETTSSIADKEELVTQMLSEVESITKSSKEMIASVDTGKDDVSSALTKVDKVVDLIETTKTLTQELSDSSTKIGQVVKTIRGISNQTNILSLNAAIEAARAGEHGRGFSIVAQEVRKLAHQTEQALDHIQGQISTVQETIDKFESSFKHIVEETSLFRDTNRNIITILETSVENVKSNDSRIHKFSGFINEFKKTFEEISDASYQIAEMAEQLSYLNNELTDKFRS